MILIKHLKPIRPSSGKKKLLSRKPFKTIGNQNNAVIISVLNLKSRIISQMVFRLSIINFYLK